VPHYLNKTTGEEYLFPSELVAGHNVDVDGDSVWLIDAGSCWIDGLTGHEFCTIPAAADSAWTPLELSPALWLDASDASTITESGGLVSQWDDKSGNGRHVEQLTGASQPAYNGTTKAIEFDGLDDYLWNTSPFMADNGASVYVACSLVASASARVVGEGLSTNNDPVYSPQCGSVVASEMAWFIRKGSPRETLHDQNIALSATGAIDGITKIYQWKDTGSVVSGRVNGGSETTSPRDSRTPNVDRFAVGALLRTSADSFAEMDVHTIIITDGTESTDDSQKLEGWVAWTFNLMHMLPIDHPYRWDGTLFGGDVLWQPSAGEMFAWWDAADADTVTESGGTVTDWNDKSGNGHHLGQTNAAKQFTYNESNGRMESDGARGMTVSFGETLSQPNSFISSSWDTLTSTGFFFDGIGVNDRNAFFRRSTGVWSQYAGSTVDITTSDRRPHVFFNEINGASSKLRVDGGSAFTQNPGAQTIDGLSVGFGYAETGSIIGYHHELFVFDGTVTDEYRQKIEGYLAWKGDGLDGVTDRVDSLPVDHPYKTYAPTV